MNAMVTKPPSPDLTKEIAHAVAADAASTAQLEENTLDAQVLSRESIRALCPQTLAPSDQQITWVEAYICATPSTSMAAVSRSLGIPGQRVRDWLRNHKEMRAWIQACLMASGEPGSIWKALRARALKGSDRAAHMYLMRYDPAYAAVQRSTPPSRKKLATPELAEAAAEARKVLEGKE